MLLLTFPIPKNNPVKKLLLLSLHIILAQCIFSQQYVSKRWDARFGGNKIDQLTTIGQTRDGGFILAGGTASGISGNKTQATYGGGDYWIVKIDSNGNYLWDKDYGSTGSDGLMSFCITRDGGCILGGTTGSNSGNDVSQPSRGGYDYWVIKLDSSGSKQWDARFGGNQDDEMYSVKQTKDGGYILSGGSTSGISGDKTQPNRDSSLITSDYWLVKIDSAGNKQWDKRFGTVGDEASTDVIQTPDGGYLLGGSCRYTDTSGDKTQSNYGPQESNFWVVKTDSFGNMEWDGVYGGTAGEIFGNSLSTRDGNYMLGGQSYDENAAGDKTAIGDGFWLIKIDTNGNRLGDWAYGSGINAGQTFSSMSNTPDNGYLLTGISAAVTGGDKTSANLSQTNVWTIKIDSQMNRVWDRTARTTFPNDASAGAIEISTGCYLIGVQTAAGMGGDKTQAAWDSSYDYWVVEYCDSFPLGIQETQGAMHLLVYPNPASSDLYINIQKDDLAGASFTLTNTTGQIVYQGTPDHLAHSYTKIIELSGLPIGVYMLAVTVDGERIVKKVLKQ